MILLIDTRALKTVLQTFGFVITNLNKIYFKSKLVSRYSYNFKPSRPRSLFQFSRHNIMSIIIRQAQALPYLTLGLGYLSLSLRTVLIVGLCVPL